MGITSRIFKDNWFVIGLLAVCLATLLDSTGSVAELGQFLKSHRGADWVIIVIFFCSGLTLNRAQMQAGIKDIRGTLAALILIFLVAPLLAIAMTLMPLNASITIGLLLVSAMPTTMSSGVVMSGAAGGNTAHALMITVLANGLSVVTVPLTLSLLFQRVGPIPLDRGRMIFEMFLLVLVPLAAGIALRPSREAIMRPLRKVVPVLNQSLILCMVWMGLSGALATLLKAGDNLLVIGLLSFFFHGLLLLLCFAAVRILGISKGRMEAVIFMGGQKTLSLPVLLQVKLFPENGLALVFCVLHHFIHLIMDGYLVGILKKR